MRSSAHGEPVEPWTVNIDCLKGIRKGSPGSGRYVIGVDEGSAGLEIKAAISNTVGWAGPKATAYWRNPVSCWSPSSWAPFKE